MDHILEILSNLINFRSITPHSAGAIEYIADLLQNNGFSINIQKFGSDDSQVYNLYARYGSLNPNICFAGHVDVVPPGDLRKWQHDPFKIKIIDNKIFGRGTVDMKGTIACMLAATIKFILNNPQPSGSISFLLTSDEEGAAEHGTKKMLLYLKDKNEKIDFTILGEPTSEHLVGDTIKIGRRGSINFTLKINGKQGHVAYPNEAINPIHILVRVLNELCKYCFDQGTEFFQSSNLEVTNIDIGNDTTNVIPNQATAIFNIRFNDSHNEKELISIISDIVSKYIKDYEPLSKLSADCFIQKPNDYIKQFLQVASEVCSASTKFSTSGGTSDARFIKNYSSVVEFGLLHKTAHQIDEHTKINDLQLAHDVYYNALIKFLR